MAVLLLAWCGTGEPCGIGRCLSHAALWEVLNVRELSWLLENAK